ncbi:MAG TPA: glycerol-3-phosphate transporter, partial [Stellaceae bacterium]|nr:glycerol-3-phosphate transporter [Stellaceae bacterium]
MVTARQSAWIPHAILITGLAVVLFPIYVAIVASTHDLPTILDMPMTLVPGTQIVRNFTDAITIGTAKTSGVSVGRMMLNSLVMALVIAAGKIAIS